MSRTFGRRGFQAGLRSDVAASGGTGPDAGQLLWVHATSAARLAGLCDLASRLKEDREDLCVLATWDPIRMEPPANHGPECDQIAPLPTGPSGALRQFLAAWQPAAAIWTGGYLNSALVRLADERGVPLILLDADPEAFGSSKRRWFFDPQQDALNRFRQILASSDAAVTTLRRAGCEAERIVRTAPFRALPALPDGSDEDVVDVGRELAGRPVWLAAHPGAEEFALVLTAYRNVLRLAHRLMLVVVPEDRGDLDDIVELAEGMTLRHAVWRLGDPILEETQILVADDPEDLGLWYRIAPQTFMGHTLVAGSGRDPMEAAALGSAVLIGPNTGDYTQSCARLIRAGAAELVAAGPDLATHVSRLTAPDVAARMALAGWDVASEGAELTEQMVVTITELLDADEAA